MRKIIVFEHISLDGVIQAPGGKDEDTSGGFSLGGWTKGFSDEISGQAVQDKLHTSFDLLIGRKTYDIWAPYWPSHDEIWPEVNRATKYVVSSTLSKADWQPSLIINSFMIEKIKQIKDENKPDLFVWGSSELVHSLLVNDLVDGLWLMVYPVILGHGKRLFKGGEFPSVFSLEDSLTNSKGVMINTYERDKTFLFDY